MTRSSLTALGAMLAVAAVAASCYLGLGSDDPAGSSGVASSPQAQSSRATGDESSLSRSEWNARVTAGKPIAEQPEPQQRRYHETWLGALQRTQAGQREALEQLRAQRKALATDAQARKALDARTAELQSALDARAERIAQHTQAVAALR